MTARLLASERDAAARKLAVRSISVNGGWWDNGGCSTVLATRPVADRVATGGVKAVLFGRSGEVTLAAGGTSGRATCQTSLATRRPWMGHVFAAEQGGDGGGDE